MFWKNFKKKFNEKSYNTRLVLREVYSDILRVIFSRYFVRNRRIFSFLLTFPILSYLVLFEIDEYTQIHDHRTRKKHLVANQLLEERGLVQQDEETYTHYSNYMKAHFPR